MRVKAEPLHISTQRDAVRFEDDEPLLPARWENGSRFIDAVNVVPVRLIELTHLSDGIQAFGQPADVGRRKAERVEIGLGVGQDVGFSAERGRTGELILGPGGENALASDDDDTVETDDLRGGPDRVQELLSVHASQSLVA